MHIKRFREEKKRKKQILLFTVICIFLISGVFLYRTYALFETKEDFNIVNGNTENPGDLYFAYYVNNERSLQMPTKESGLTLDDESFCTNGVKISWNADSWQANIDYSNYKLNNKSQTRCNLYFRDAEFSDYLTSCGQNNTSASECMKKYARVDTVNLAYDETVDNNLRYIGANPNNYVSFNNELWRMIGVMDNVDDGTGKKESRIKLIRNESIGEFSWDSSASGINGGYGVNEWSEADVMKLLNPSHESELVGGSLYWNRAKGNCYSDENNNIVECDFSNTGLLENSKNMIAETLWNIGTNGDEFKFNEILASKFYVLERGQRKIFCTNTIYCNDTVTRTTSWKGPVALMYPSDYGYATSGGNNIDRDTCLAKILYSWGTSELSDCRTNNWLYNSYNHHWTITPSSVSTNRADAFYVSRDGHVVSVTADNAFAIVPTLYLKSNLKITSGLGTNQNPYILSVN